ncbi:MAG: hypothetical protein KAX44_02140 [Candidatus Brocadiae bacterium]|nr:hypothetical protein [Candidatus Brocadiia bacterium]
MLPKERIRAAFNKEPTDRVPIHHIGFSSQVASMVLGREAYVGGGIQQWREACALWQGEEAHREFVQRSRQDAFDLAMALGQDLVRMEYWRMSVRPSRKIDEHTFLYGDPDGEWRVYKSDPETELYQLVDQHPQRRELDLESLEEVVAGSEKALDAFRPTPETFDSTRQLLQTYGKEHIVRVGGGGLGIPYPAVWLEATALRPDLIGRHLDVQVERLVRSVELLAAVGVEHLFGGSDMASNDGPFYSPGTFRELMAPRLKRMSDACHKHGIRYLFASDGNLWPVADDMFGSSGVDGYYEIDGLAGMDLARLRQRYPHLTLIGNISSRTLHRGSRDDVIAQTMSCLEEAKRSNGIIVGVSNYLLPGTPAENLEALMETIEQYR